MPIRATRSWRDIRDDAYLEPSHVTDLDNTEVRERKFIADGQKLVA
jgi:hypothetical protein